MGPHLFKGGRQLDRRRRIAFVGLAAKELMREFGSRSRSTSLFKSVSSSTFDRLDRASGACGVNLLLELRGGEAIRTSLPVEVAWEVEEGDACWWCDADPIKGLVLGHAAGLQHDGGCPSREP